MLATDSVLWSILIDFLPCMDLEFGRPIKFILINLSGTYRKLLRGLKVFHERFLVGEIWEKGLVRRQYVVNANLRSSHQAEPWNLYLVDFWLLDCFLCDFPISLVLLNWLRDCFFCDLPISLILLNGKDFVTLKLLPLRAILGIYLVGQWTLPWEIFRKRNLLKMVWLDDNM